MHWFVEPCEGADNKAWAPYELGWLGVWEGVELGTSEVRSSPREGGAGDGVG